MAIRPRVMKEARGAGSVNAERIGDNEDATIPQSYLSVRIADPTARLIRLAARLEGMTLKDFCLTHLVPIAREAASRHGVDPDAYGNYR